MDRKMFIKNVFGTVLGYAILPKVIREYSESEITKEFIVHPSLSTIFVDTSRFLKNDIIMLSDGTQICLLGEEGHGEDKIFRGRQVDKNRDFIIRHHMGAEAFMAARIMSMCPESS